MQDCKTHGMSYSPVQILEEKDKKLHQNPYATKQTKSLWQQKSSCSTRISIVTAVNLKVSFPQ